MKSQSLLLLTVVIFIVSCVKSNESHTTISIKYVDTQGYNLFTDGENGYIKKDVQLYNFINGEKELITTDGLPDDDWFDIYSGNLVFNAFDKYIKSKDSYVNLLIDLKADDEDTLRAHIKNGYDDIYDTIWYNGVRQLKEDFMIVK